MLEFSNNAIQGAMDLNDPSRILFEYPRAILHLIAHNLPSFERVFIIGHGIGTIAGHLTEKRCKVAELDQTVVEISKRFLDTVAIMSALVMAVKFSQMKNRMRMILLYWMPLLKKERLRI